MLVVVMLCGFISGLMFSTVEEVNGNDTCLMVETDPKDQLKGCPTEIPVIDDKKIVAARIYQTLGNAISALSCNGVCKTYYAETRTNTTELEIALPFGSVIINPGCTVYVFRDPNYLGPSTAFEGPTILTNPPFEGGVHNCDGLPCVNSMLFTCKQVFPSCQPSDDWQVVTIVDNRDSTVSTKFTYSKTVGTTFSLAMTNSMNIDTTVSASVSSSFFDLFSAKASGSFTTGFDWSETDHIARSQATTHSVEVTIPGGVKVYIEEAVGQCGGSTIYTQMFRIKDEKNTTLRVYQGKMTKYKLSKKDF